ncbi:hypothetical protein [Gordonia sp. (in: high G+C Gram-positive bacteria)]|uniref:hypothetical protein n=1 Tax=Gordonia sp. (in: high G+C Gram-positive bacteria) TaxID=84139 RepID=UPI003C76B3CC
MTRNKLLLGALGFLVVSLIFGSVYTTGAYWSETGSLGTQTDIGTGTIGLNPHGSGDASYSFGSLTGNNIAVGNVTEKPLTIVNTGTTRIKFQLSSAGPAITSPGSTVTVTLSGSLAGTCPGGTGNLSGAFPATDTTGPATTIGSPNPGLANWRVLDKGGSESWCVRAILKTLGGTLPAAYTINFNFSVGQLRPGTNP